MIAFDNSRYALGSLFGIPIDVQQSFLVLMGLYVLMHAQGGWQAILAGLLAVVLFGASIVLHELGHALAVRYLGLGNSQVVLHALGGECQWKGTFNRRDRVLVALAGPAAGLVVGSLVWAFAPLVPNNYWVNTAVNTLLVVNIGWSLVNLLPMLPLDGGQVFEWAYARHPRAPVGAMRTVVLVSAVTAGLVGLFALVSGHLLLVLVFGWIAYLNVQRLRNYPPGSSGRGGSGRFRVYRGPSRWVN